MRFTDVTEAAMRLFARVGAAWVPVVVNIVVFVALRLILVLLCREPDDAGAVLSALELQADWSALLSRPWTLLTYMFVHVDFLHLLFNLILLCFFGMLILRQRRCVELWLLYLCGGIAGGLLFVSTGGGPGLIGASASVMAVVAAASLLDPSRRVRVSGGVSIRLMWLFVVLSAVDVLTLPAPGGEYHLAHLGGVAAGVMYALIARRQRSVAALSSQSDAARMNKDDDMDVLLRKVRTSGHSSLTPEERRRLFRMSGDKHEHRR